MIRPLELNDVSACITISKIIFKAENYEYDVERYLRSHFDPHQFIRPDFFVYEGSGIIQGLIGFSETGFDSGVFGIFMCYVHPDFQNRGAGKALTERALLEIKKRGGLSVFATTRKAWHFERFGFRKIRSPYPDWDIMQMIF
jgi:N-acetylglutamate synthase-like GNAT family acetyltransferase